MGESLRLLEKFARARQFLAPNEPFPTDGIVKGKIELLGKVRDFSMDPVRGRWIDVMNVMSPVPVVLGPLGKPQALPEADLIALTTRPKLAWAPAEKRFRAALWLFRKDGSQLPTPQEFEKWSASRNDLAQELSAIDKKIRAAWAKWLDPVTRLRSDGFEAAAIMWRNKIKAHQEKMANARKAYSAMLKDYQAILAERDTQLRSMDANWSGKAKTSDALASEIGLGGGEAPSNNLPIPPVPPSLDDLEFPDGDF